MLKKIKQRKLSNRVEKHVVLKMQNELKESYKQKSLMTFF